MFRSLALVVATALGLAVAPNARADDDWEDRWEDYQERLEEQREDYEDWLEDERERRQKYYRRWHPGRYYAPPYYHSRYYYHPSPYRIYGPARGFSIRVPFVRFSVGW